MQLQYRMSNGKVVACRAHVDCPMLTQKPPTVETCWEHVVLPNFWRPKEWDKMSDKKKKEAVKVYYQHQGVIKSEQQTE